MIRKIVNRNVNRTVVTRINMQTVIDEKTSVYLSHSQAVPSDHVVRYVEFLFGLDVHQSVSRNLEPVAGTKPSGITSKPAIEDHFKTGQRTITLDDLFYLIGWRSGKSSWLQSGR